MMATTDEKLDQIIAMLTAMNPQPELTDGEVTERLGRMRYQIHLLEQQVAKLVQKKLNIIAMLTVKNPQLELTEEEVTERLERTRHQILLLKQQVAELAQKKLNS